MMKPCPFCAGTNLNKSGSATWSHYFVECLDCGAKGPTKYDGDPYGTSGDRNKRYQPARDAWNKRRRSNKAP